MPKLWLAFHFIILIVVGLNVEAAEKNNHVLAAIEENDLLYNPKTGEHQDRHYSQGLKMIYLASGEAPGWAKFLQLDDAVSRLPEIGIEPVVASYGVTLGQNIYTPENHLATNLIANDRPYAGWLYVGLAIQRHGTVADSIPVLESLELNIGIIGPEAQGGKSQNEVHKIRDLPTFDGWRNQIKTEPAFVFRYGRAWRLSLNETSANYLDLIPRVGMNLGTLAVSGSVGVTARLGIHLPADFGLQTIDSPILISSGIAKNRFGFYIFGGAEGRAVGRNAFLDGNLYTSSFHVDKKPFVGDLIYGVALTLGPHVQGGWTFVTRSPEFKGQNGSDRFGSIYGKLNWDF